MSIESIVSKWTAPTQLRSMAEALGIASLAFGAAGALAPRFFGRLLGIDAVSPVSASLIRSVGVRDAVIGMGLWSAARHGGKYQPWVLARALADAGDAVAVGLAMREGVRAPRLLGLGGLALSSAAFGFWLYRTARPAAALGQ